MGLPAGAGSDTLPPRSTAGGADAAAATTLLSTSNVELVVMDVGEDRAHSFDGMVDTTDSDAAAMPEDNHGDNHGGGSGASRTWPAVDSHQEQGTAALVTAAANNSEQRRQCRGCREWWQSSAGGVLGVFSIILAVIIVLYAALIVALPALTDAVVKAETGIRNAAEVLFQVTTYVKVIVGSISMLLIFFGAWTIRRATCARESTLEDIAKTAEARRDHTWFAIRVFTLIQEGKGPNSP